LLQSLLSQHIPSSVYIVHILFQDQLPSSLVIQGLEVEIGDVPECLCDHDFQEDDTRGYDCHYHSSRGIILIHTSMFAYQ